MYGPQNHLTREIVYVFEIKIIQLTVFFVFFAVLHITRLCWIGITSTSIVSVAEKRVKDKHHNVKCKSDNGIILAGFKEATHQQWLDEYQVVFDRNCKQLSELQNTNMTLNSQGQLIIVFVFGSIQRKLKKESKTCTYSVIDYHR